MKNHTYKVLIFNLVWVFSIVFVVLLMTHSDCKVGYGFIVGYFVALMYAYFFEVNKIRYFIYSIFLYILFGILIVFVNYPFPIFYKDIPSDVSLFYLGILFLKSLIFNSPIIIVKTIKLIKDNDIKTT